MRERAPRSVWRCGLADKIRILIADDHAVVRHGLKLFLNLCDDITVIGEAGDGVDAVEKAKALLPDVVVMDLVMPRLDGIQATLGIREDCPETKVLVLTSFAEDDKVFPALRAGAAGYLMKDAEPEQLAEAIRTVYRGDPLLHPEVTRRLMLQISQAQPEPEGTVTILFTDIEGSTAIVQELGDERARPVFLEHDVLVREVLKKHGGLEVKHQGDGFMVAFSSARRAVLCAADIQLAIARHNRERPEMAVRVRIGLNTGETISEEHDYFGEAVILASRITDRAQGSQILVSELTKALVGTKGIHFLDRGRHHLKGLSGTHRLFEVAWAEGGG